MTDLNKRIDELTNARPPAAKVPAPTQADIDFAQNVARAVKARYGAAIEADRNGTTTGASGHQSAPCRPVAANPPVTPAAASSLGTAITSCVDDGDGDIHTKVTLDSSVPGTATLVISTKNPDLVQNLEEFAGAFAQLDGVTSVNESAVPVATKFKTAPKAGCRCRAPKEVKAPTPEPAKLPRVLTTKDLILLSEWEVGPKYLQAVTDAAKTVLSQPELVEKIRVAVQAYSGFANKITTRQAKWLIAVTFLLARATDATTSDLAAFGKELRLENPTKDTVSGFLRRLINVELLLETPVKQSNQITVNTRPNVTERINVAIIEFRDNN